MDGVKSDFSSEKKRKKEKKEKKNSIFKGLALVSGVLSSVCFVAFPSKELIDELKHVPGMKRFLPLSESAESANSCVVF